MDKRERQDLNHWLKQKKQAEKQVERLTTDPVTHKKYATLFKKEVELRIRTKYPNLASYKQYAIYQNVRKALHDYFGYDTPMMTKGEYEEAIKFISKLSY